MPRRSRVDSFVLSEIAPRRVARVADLVDAGLASSTVARRVRSGGWQRVHPGTLVLHGGPQTRAQLIEAALLYAGDGAVLSGLDSAQRHGLTGLPTREAVHVLVPAARRRRSSGLILVERTSRLPEPVERGGTPVAPVERAVLDAARCSGEVDDVRAVLAAAVQQRATTVARLARELAAGSQRGSALPREVLTELGDGIRSAAEGWARTVHARSTLPPVLWNPRLHLPNGRFLASPDGFFPDVALAWEIDSFAYHPDGDAATARRRADMVRAGVPVVSHRPRQLRVEPERVVEELWAYYALAASRPRPALRVTPAPSCA